MKFDTPSGHPSEDNRNGMQIIATYEAILTITDQMLQAAKNSDWDRLVALEQDCKHLTTWLIEQHTYEQLSDEQKKKKVSLIHEILERDAEIRNITEPWMTQLQNKLTSYGQKRKLGQTYQTDS
ncbi:flagellar protein FliT [Nitrosomonas sp.]|uniref:flagellar protein FliT n=1 Tax=Nitrosomonas sp. TaxID=42353 RepID=UPI003306907F